MRWRNHSPPPRGEMRYTGAPVHEKRVAVVEALFRRTFFLRGIPRFVIDIVNIGREEREEDGLCHNQ